VTNAIDPSAMTKNERPSAPGFTLMELMVVVIIIGAIAAFAIPNYNKSIQKAHERDMLAQLTMIHAANLIYRSYEGKYWYAAGDPQNLAAINSALSINIIANAGTVYTYTSAGGGTFKATAVWGACTLGVTEAPIDSTNNPCRSSGIGTCLLALNACP
jgi:prepilin-type N-terminal cleavage/methylation domain-containing protein